jgi:transposase
MSQNNKRELELKESQETTLIEMRDHHAKPYLRERAAALLKIAAGYSASWVARHGLLKQRDVRTVIGWLDAYEADGLGGLYIKDGRGRPAAYEP